MWRKRRFCDAHLLLKELKSVMTLLGGLFVDARRQNVTHLRRFPAFEINLKTALTSRLLLFRLRAIAKVADFVVSCCTAY